MCVAYSGASASQGLDAAGTLDSSVQVIGSSCCMRSGCCAAQRAAVWAGEGESREQLGRGQTVLAALAGQLRPAVTASASDKCGWVLLLVAAGCWLLLLPLLPLLRLLLLLLRSLRPLARRQGAVQICTAP